MQNTLHHLTTSVLFSEDLAQASFPEVQITYLGCNQSNWGTVWCTLETKRRYDKVIAEGKNIRKINFVTLEDCNHFVRLFCHLESTSDFRCRLTMTDRRNSCRNWQTAYDSLIVARYV